MSFLSDYFTFRGSLLFLLLPCELPAEDSQNSWTMSWVFLSVSSMQPQWFTFHFAFHLGIKWKIIYEIIHSNMKTPLFLFSWERIKATFLKNQTGCSSSRVIYKQLTKIIPLVIIFLVTPSLCPLFISPSFRLLVLLKEWWPVIWLKILATFPFQLYLSTILMQHISEPNEKGRHNPWPHGTYSL